MLLTSAGASHTKDQLCTPINLEISEASTSSSNITNATEETISALVDPDNDENCSVTSEISLFASSLSDIVNSPSRDDFSDECSNTKTDEANLKNCGVARKSATETLDFLERPDITIDEKIEAIFALTIKNSPEKMISPIKDLKLSSIRSGSMTNSNNQRKKFHTNRTPRYCEAIQRENKRHESDNSTSTRRYLSDVTLQASEPSKSEGTVNLAKRSKPETPSKFNERSTGVESIPQRQDLREDYKPSLEFKNMEKFTITITGENRRSVKRNDSIHTDNPTSTVTHIPSTPTLAAAAEASVPLCEPDISDSS